MKKAFSLVEILIVVAILGIIAAIITPTFQGRATEAKEAVAKDNLRILRSAIEAYAVRNNGIPPGYSQNVPTRPPSPLILRSQLQKLGHYFQKTPVNPFNGSYRFKVLTNDEEFPSAPVETDTYGWIYQPSTFTVKLNWEGTDSASVAYFDY